MVEGKLEGLPGDGDAPRGDAQERAASFTPGPWQVRDDYTSEGSLTIIGNVDGEYFTDSAQPHMSYEFVALLVDEYGEWHERAAANARLIAAAPDGYAAAKDALAGWRYIRKHHGDLYGVGWDRVEKALSDFISKAEGR